MAGCRSRSPRAAVVVGHGLAVAACVVVDDHPFAALAADHEALQERRAFAGGAGAALLAAGGGVRLKRCEVALVLLEGDVSGVRVLDQHGPLVLWLEHGASVTVDVGELLASSVEVRARIPGVVQGEQHQVVAQRLPVELAAVRSSGRVSAGDAQLLGSELLDDRVRRAGPLNAWNRYSIAARTLASGSSVRSRAGHSQGRPAPPASGATGVASRCAPAGWRSGGTAPPGRCSPTPRANP